MKTFSEWLISEGTTQALSRAIPRQHIQIYKSQLADMMPSAKVKHSLRVGKTLAKSGAHPNAVKAALFHDYLERGGTASIIHKNLPAHAATLVKHLSSDVKNTKSTSENEPLDHVKKVLSHPSMTKELKNHFIQVKLADRHDNLKKRQNAGGIGQNYKAKSTELVHHLLHHYSGDHEPINALRKKLKAVGIDSKKKHIGTLA